MAINDSFTELNEGSGGSKMDESALVQTTGETAVETEVKRPRVVLGGNDGSLVDVVRHTGGKTSLPVVVEETLLHAVERNNELLEQILHVLQEKL